MKITRELVKDISIFSELTEEEFIELSGMTEVVKVKAGEVLLKQRDKSEAFYIILEGELEVLKEMKKGKIKKLVEMGPGAIVGEMAFIAGTRRSATIKALTDITLIKIKNKPFKASMAEGESLASYKVILHIAKNLSKKLKIQIDRFQILYEKKGQGKKKDSIFSSLKHIFSIK